MAASASTSASATRIGDEISILKDQLYEACQDAWAGNYERPLSQDDLMSLDVIPPKDIKKLMDVISVLTRERLFAPVHMHSGLAWRMRPEAEAAKYKLMASQDQTLVYEVVDAAGADGTWVQDIRRRLNMQDKALQKTLKELESKRLVTPFTSSENPNKRMWIKFGVTPSSRATGGPFYTDSYLDEALVDKLSDCVVNFIKEYGSYETNRQLDNPRAPSPLQPKKGVVRGAPPDPAHRGKKRGADAISGGDATSAVKSSRTAAPATQLRTPRRIPMPAGYNAYMTAKDVEGLLAESHVQRGQIIDLKHTQELLDVLVWDGRLEEVDMADGVRGYRAVRVARTNPSNAISLDDPDYWEPRDSGLISAPCGRCPVFDLCEEGGPVWAGGCEYFDKWLA